MGWYQTDSLLDESADRQMAVCAFLHDETLISTKSAKSKNFSKKHFYFLLNNKLPFTLIC